MTTIDVFVHGAQCVCQLISVGLTDLLCTGDTEPVVRMVQLLGSSAPIEGALVVSYPDEKSLLLDFAKRVQDIDPDIITGYNVNSFDLKV